MNMIILTKEQNSELREINDSNLHLSRAVQPMKLKDDTYAVGSDVLQDKETWENWIEFLSELPQREVSEDEYDLAGSGGWLE